MTGRGSILALVAALLTVHAVVVGHKLESAFFIVSYFWAWIAFNAVTGRMEPVKSMAATMIVLLLASAIFLMLTPFGRGDTAGFYALAWFPSIVAFASVFVFAVYLERSDLAPRVSDDVTAVVTMPNFLRDADAQRMAAEQFARQLEENAVGREQRGEEEVLEVPAAEAPEPVIPRFAVSKVA